jgi:hypothetical protein
VPAAAHPMSSISHIRFVRVVFLTNAALPDPDVDAFKSSGRTGTSHADRRRQDNVRGAPGGPGLGACPNRCDAWQWQGSI